MKKTPEEIQATLARPLTITRKQMEELVVKLSRNQPVPGVADTGTVKPELERNDSTSVEECISYSNSPTYEHVPTLSKKVS